ncbi:MucBP domain-containing protein [Lactococcus formosensis]|nr:MucBP domain-containing protein [Lactococcus formosensis]
MKKKFFYLVSTTIIFSCLFLPVTTLAADAEFCFPSNNIERSETIILDTENKTEKEITLKVQKNENKKEKIDYELLIDGSGSMRDSGSIETTKSAITTFINSLDKDRERVAVSVFRGPGYSGGGVLAYDTSVESLSDFTNDYANVLNKIQNMELGGHTPLLDGLTHSLSKIEAAAHNGARKVLIIFTDGAPNIGPKRDYFISPKNYEHYDGQPYINSASNYPGNSNYYEYLAAKKLLEEYDSDDDEEYLELSEKVDSYLNQDVKYPLGYKTNISQLNGLDGVNLAYEGRLYSNHLQEFYDLMSLIQDKTQEIKSKNIEIFTLFLNNMEGDPSAVALNKNNEVELLFEKISQDSNHYLSTNDMNDLENKFINISETVNKYSYQICDEVETGYELVPNSFKYSHPMIKETVNKNNIKWSAFGIEDEEVTVSYRIVKVRGTVKTEYVDQDGVEIESSEFSSDKVGVEYQTQAKEIEGYTLTKTPDNASGTYTSETQKVIYIYTPNKAPEIPELVEGKVVVDYVDETGKNIAQSSEISDKVGVEYQTQAKEIEGYNERKLPKTGEKENKFYFIIGLFIIFSACLIKLNTDEYLKKN